MDIIELIRDIGKLNETEFNDCLLKKIPMEFYYVLDLIINTTDITVNVLKREGNPLEIPKRIKLYEYCVNNKIGCSLSTYAFKNTESLENHLNELKSKFNIEELNNIESKKINYINDEEEFEEKYNLKFRGYITIAINGKLLVDNINNYDEILIKEIYETSKYKGNKNCYLCNSESDLICGGIKEPGIKLLSVTRVNEISTNKNEVFIRCKKCEELLMKGFNIINDLSIKSKRGNEDFYSVLIPIYDNSRLLKQMKGLREETNSDLKYYERLERLFNRYKPRGLNQIIEIVLSKKLKNITVSSLDILNIDDLNRLKYKNKYDKFLEINKFKNEDNDLLYYPIELIKNKNDLKWNLIDKVKRYWLGKETEMIWDLVKEITKLPEREILKYKLFNKYIEIGEERFLEEIKKDKYYWIGRYVKEIIYLESKYEKNKLAENKVIKRFVVKNKNYDYVLKECQKVYSNLISSCDIIEEDKLLINEIEKELFICEKSNESYYLLGRFERKGIE